MVSTSIAQPVLAPKKRAEALAIVTHALAGAQLPLVYIMGYNVMIALLLVVLYPTLTQGSMQGFFTSYLANPVVSGIIGSSGVRDFTGYSAFIGIYFYSSFGGVLFGGILAYIGGAALPANIENGMLDLALSRPISRTRYYLETWLAVILSGIILTLLTALVLWISTFFVSKPNINWQWLWITQLIQLALFFCAGGLGMLMGSLFNNSRSAAGVAVGILVLGYLFNTMGGLADKLSWLLKISPFYYAPAMQPLVLHQFTWWHPWVLVIAGLVCGIAGLFIFKKRDFPTV